MSDEDGIAPGTMTRLLRDLRSKPKDSLRDEFITKDEAGVYHDFRSEAATPKVDLDADLRRVGYEDLVRACRRGEYDDEQSEEDRERIAAEVGETLGKALLAAAERCRNGRN